MVTNNTLTLVWLGQRQSDDLFDASLQLGWAEPAQRRDRAPAVARVE
jgi:hypothetical protein